MKRVLSEIDKTLEDIQRTKTNGNSNQVAELYNYLGSLYFENEQYEEALDAHLVAVRMCEEIGNDLELCIGHRKIGEVKSEQKKFEEALEHDRIYLELSRKLKNPVEEQRAIVTIGRTYFLRFFSTNNSEDLESAESMFLKSLELTELLENEVPHKEIQSMKARLYLNLGQTYWNQDKKELGKEHIIKSLRISQNENLTDDIVRCHYSLSEFYLVEESYDLSMEHAKNSYAASKLRKSKQEMVESLTLLSKIFLAKKDYNQSKVKLKEAYKLSLNISSLSREVGSDLIKVIKLCKLSNELFECHDQSKRVSLEENIADCLVGLKLYNQALDHYLSAVLLAEDLKFSSTELAKLYVSVAKTYEDMLLFDDAIKWYQKEIEISSPSEIAQTLLSLINIKQQQGAEFKEVRELCQRAISEAELSEDKTVMLKVLKWINDVQKDFDVHFLIENIDEKLADLESDIGAYSPSLSPNEMLENENVSDFTDLESDSEEIVQVSRSRQPRRALILKKNEMGETPLHISCIKGDINKVTMLLEQGHPVDCKDNCNWTPLHEACNHGFIEIAQLLLDHGAPINAIGGDKGSCLTPLQDAASCGHFDVIDLLLDNGADANLVSNEGETALDMLISWKKRCIEEEGGTGSWIDQYNACCHRLKSSTSIRKVRDDHKVLVARYPKFTSNIDECSQQTDEISSDKQKIPAAQEYKDAMIAIGSARQLQSKRKLMGEAGQSKRWCKSSLLSEDEVVRDWLVDDLAQTRPGRKKRTLTADLLSGITTHRRHYNSDRSEACVADRSEACVANSPIRSQGDESSVQFEDSEDFNNIEAISGASSPRTADNSAKDINVHQDKLFPSPGVTVDVEGCFIFIPVDFTNQRLTIAWLTTEVANRYHRMFDDCPSITLKNSNGALLCLEDILSVSVTPGETLRAEVISWSLEVPDAVEQQIKSCRISSGLDLRRHPCSSKVLIHVMKQVENEQTLTTLNLDNNLLSNVCKELGASLSNLINLKTLSMKCCGLTSKSIQILRDSLFKPMELKLQCLDISYNNIADQGMTFLADILQHSCDLSCLSLISCKITGSCFLQTEVQNIFARMTLTELKLSYNLLDQNALIKVLSVVPKSTITNMELNRVVKICDMEFMSRFSLCFQQFNSLKSIDLSANYFSDLDLSSIIANIPNDNMIAVFRMQDSKITIKSVKTIIKKLQQLETMDLQGCLEVFKEKTIIEFGNLQTVIGHIVPSVQKFWCDLWCKGFERVSSVHRLSPSTFILKRSK